MKKQIEQINNQDSRFYLINGKYYPSVTSILTIYPKGIGFYKWLVGNGSWDEAERIKEEAGDRGAKVHNAIIQLIKGKQLRLMTAKGDERIFTEEEWKAILAFKNWWEDFKPITSDCEKMVYSEKFGFAGTVDWIGYIHISDKSGKKKKCLAMLDWKTSKSIYSSSLIQVAAYAFANAEMKGEPIDSLAVVQLGSKAKRKYTMKFIDDRKSCFKVFLATKQIWEFENPGVEPQIEELPGEIRLQKYEKV